MQQRLTLVHSANQPMINLQNFVLALAQARPIPPSAETLIRDRLHRFISDYRTPDHPTYSHMIENALGVLNEKGGSSQKSISQYLEKNYDNLPWAHAGLLKHHLQRACQEGQVIRSRRNKYRLARDVDSGTKVSKKPRQTNWKWECEAEKPQQLKIRLVKKRNDESETVKECDEKEEALTENSEDQTKSWLSCVGEKSFHTNSPSILQDGMIAAADEKKCSEEEDGPCSVAEAGIHTPEHRVDHEQPEPSTPERPPGLDSFGVENVHESDVVDVIKGHEESELPAVLQTEPDMMTIDSSEFALLIEQEPQEQPPLPKEEILQGKQLRRSLRTRPARPQISRDIAALLPIDCHKGHPVTVPRRQRMLLKQSPRSWPPTKATSVDKLQDSPKSRNEIMPRLLKPVKYVDDCREEEFKQTGSTHVPKPHLHKALKEQQLGRPPTRRSARLLNQT
ncbi:hypothetical protein SASPL_140495 [Salvia splendens]|uniref:H15 domain-containing protein n=2 Tax=Salvia splendens TaxID=180675 RepID=A0A4D9BPZ9_SALSN|nr:uncharacterized protein LOC121767379 isoform X1 [Salvia splendens]XP_042019601.1 uncharacterized protein LOC121767401 isoform X1 [Salvia splendens]KAG6399021.1 hypothetical protein SASPL_140494 [Salvia splendens]KAG6399022.1 hypothetical protein SASPL_140495 [Salvia splendens]